jgi:O-acetyl-ADP-ribose deacetylase (regulator of RNase III)
MLHEVEGDLLLTGAQAIAHGVSPNDHFDVGLALGLRDEWPSMAKDFRHYARQSHPKPGEVWEYRTTDGRVIYNLITQDGEQMRGGSSGMATVSHVHHALKALRQLLDANAVRSLALPRLATGAGRLDWAEVQPLVQQHLGDLDIPVYVYTTYHKGQKAAEPGVEGAAAG